MQNMTDEQKLLLDKLLDATSAGNLDPAYEELGRCDPQTAAMSVEDIVEIVHAGWLWWTAQEQRMRELVCTNEEIQLVAKNPNTKDIVLAVAAAIDHAVGAQELIPVAVLIARQELARWCQWTQ